MEASSGRTRIRPIVIDFLGTLFVTFCIGVAAAILLAACVMLMAGDAQGSAPEKRLPPAPAELVMTHFLAAKYVGLVAVERVVPADGKSPD